MSIENIDHLLTPSSSSHAVPEASLKIEEPADIAESAEHSTDINNNDYEVQDNKSSDSSQKSAESADSEDEYGNKKVSRTYTEDEVNERINKAVRERLSRVERNKSEPQPQQIRQEESHEAWQQQLEQLVEQTFHKMNHKATESQRIQRDQQEQAEFEYKFSQSMNRFNDYVDVVGKLPITDAMVVATKAMDDPAAFLYAASKRAPDEIKRISEMRDPLKQIIEVGKLEERMRKQKSTSNAPKPISRTKEDSSMHYHDDKKPTIEDLIAQSNTKRLALRKLRTR